MNKESICHISANNKSNYVPLRNFGTSLSPLLRTDPVGYSIYRDVDSFFDEGSLARTFGPATESSQLYMAEKCSKNWDGACELLSRNNDTSKPNLALPESPLFRQNEPGTMSIGDYLVLNSAIRRFGTFDTCSFTESLYNVNDPTSPVVKDIGSYSTKPCLPVCKPPANPDSDIILNKVLAQPQKFSDLLVNMYYNCRNERDKYKNTKIGNMFNLLDQFFKQK